MNSARPRFQPCPRCGQTVELGETPSGRLILIDIGVSDLPSPWQRQLAGLHACTRSRMNPRPQPSVRRERHPRHYARADSDSPSLAGKGPGDRS